jgi:hypothetical protein
VTTGNFNRLACLQALSGGCLRGAEPRCLIVRIQQPGNVSFPVDALPRRQAEQVEEVPMVGLVLYLV